jgi:hypothetical protein
MLVFGVAVYGVHDLSITPTTITTDQTFEVSCKFEASGAKAKVILYLDVDGNGELDTTVDKWISKRKAIDGGFDDEDEREDGTYREICPPLMNSGKYLLYAEDNGVSDTVAFTINNLSSSYSVSGKVTTPSNQSNILVSLVKIIDEETMEYELGYGDFTDATGAYSINVPREDSGTKWSVVAFDVAMVVPDYVSNCPKTDTIIIDGAETMDIEMRSESGTTVSGVLKDDAGDTITEPASLVGGGAIMGNEPVRIRPCKTGNDGRYSITFLQGTMGYQYFVTSSGIVGQFYGEYMNPATKSTQGFIAPPNIVLDLTAYRTNSTISGRVYLDGRPYDKCEVTAGSEEGGSYAKTYSDGTYEIPVSDQISSYTIRILPACIPEGHKVTPEETTASPGATGIDFNIIGVEEETKPDLPSLMVWQNPVGSKVVFKLSHAKGVGNLILYDIAGNYVCEIKPELKEENICFILRERLPTGIYFYSLKIENKTFCGKIVKLR